MSTGRLKNSEYKGIDATYDCSVNTKCKGFTRLMYEVMRTKDNPLSKEDLDILLHLDDINATNEKGWTALMLAARNSNTTSTEETVQMLIDVGAELNLQNKNGWTALMKAARYSNSGSTETTVKMLLDAGADMNLQNNNGWTALMLAARYSNTDSTETTVKMLLDAGADMNLQNNNGWTALMLAARYSNMDSTETTVKMLLDAGADVNLVTVDGKTSINIILQREELPSYVKNIINKNTNISRELDYLFNETDREKYDRAYRLLTGLDMNSISGESEDKSTNEDYYNTLDEKTKGERKVSMKINESMEKLQSITFGENNKIILNFK